MSPYILEAEGLSKDFGGFLAVSGVDLRVRRGTIHAHARAWANSLCAVIAAAFTS